MGATGSCSRDLSESYGHDMFAFLHNRGSSCKQGAWCQLMESFWWPETLQAMNQHCNTNVVEFLTGAGQMQCT